MFPARSAGGLLGFDQLSELVTGDARWQLRQIENIEREFLHHAPGRETDLDYGLISRPQNRLFE